ncbi:MAG: J domain-containing protein [Methylococcaceae bacterium]|nr:J domain-containing protein [Methylococcaceae bacterium]
MSPYEVLGVTEDADDAEIKQAYLAKVKENPPERDQQQFKEIHDAYTLIKDDKSRLSFQLFTLPSVDFDLLLDQALRTESSEELTAKVFQQILKASVDESHLLKITNQAGKHV